MDQQSTIQKSLMDVLGLSNLPQEKQEELVMKMTEVLLKRIFIETMEKLKEGDQEEYAKMIEEKASPEDVEKFLKEKISDYDQVFEKIVADFKKEMARGL
jgi:galactose-1-phosphate uridylyltransferase